MERKKLNDDSITPALVKRMKTNLLVKAIPSDINDVLTRIKLGRTLYGPAGVHAGVLDDPWCSTCQQEDNLEIEDSLVHSLFSCPHMFNIIEGITKYFLNITPTCTDFIMGVSQSNIDHTINKQYGCLITSLVYNITVHLVTKRRRACKPLVASLIIREVISCLESFKDNCPRHQITGILLDPTIAHFTTYNENLLLD